MIGEDEDFLDKLVTAQSEKKRLTVYLPKKLAHQLKVYAVLHKVSVSDVCEEVLAKRLEGFVVPKT
jgi:hypothetical protein